MTFLTPLGAGLGDQATQLLGLLLVWATLLLGSAWLIAGLLRRASSSVRYCVWQFALMGLLALPIVFALLPGVPLGFSLKVAERETSVLQEGNATAPAIPSVGAQNFAFQTPAADSAPTLTNELRSVPIELQSPRDSQPENLATSKIEKSFATPSAKPSAAPVIPDAPVAKTSPIPWSEILAVVWVVGVTVQLAWLLRCVARAGRLTRGAHALNDARISQIKADLAARLSLSRQVELLISGATTVPVVVGALRPRILLPLDCGGWSDAKLRMVLSHELAHVERRDVFWQLAARAAAALYWFHPLAWLALWRMRDERERACDDRVLSTGVAAIDYATGLVEVAAALAGRPARWVGAIGMAERLPLEDRVRSILDAASPRNPASRRARGLLLAVTVCLVLGLGVLRPFSSPAVAATEASAEEATIDKPAEPKSSPEKSDEKSAETKSAAAEPATANRPADKKAFDEKGNQHTKGSMLVRAKDSNGKPVAGVKIHSSIWTYDPGFKANRDYETDAKGEAKVVLPESLYILRLWAKKPGYVPDWKGWENEPAAKRELIPEVFTFDLQTGTVIGGIVVDDEAKPVAGAKLQVDVNGRLTLAEDDDLRTDSQGRWELNNAPQGDDLKIRVMASHPDFISLRSSYDMGLDPPLPNKELREETATIILKRGVRLTGTITDPTGKPVKDAVVIWGDNPYFENRPQQEVRTDAQGVYHFPPLPPGPMHVTVAAVGWMPERVKVQITPVTPAMNFALKPGKKLRIRFVDQAGKPIPKVGVGLSEWRGAESLYNVKHPNVLDTKIPQMADKDGIYEWTWAPDDAVKFRFEEEGFADVETSITADDTEHTVTLHPLLRFAGKVVDAKSELPIEEFAVVPVIYFRADFPSVEHYAAKEFTHGEFEIEFERGDVEHGLQIESPGYVTQRVGPYKIGAELPPFEFKLKPADRFVGRVVNETGQPVAGARVYAGSYSEHLYLRDLHKEDGGRSSNYWVQTNDQGGFEIANQLERYCLVVVSDQGYAEADRSLGALPGELKLRRWAKISGRLMQAGKPIEDESVNIDPIRDEGGDAPRGTVSFYATTTEGGKFVFDRVPPVPCRVEAFLHWSVEGPLSSSQSVPLDPAPGEQLTVSLGEKGAEVTGQLALDPPPTGEFDYHFGLNYLVARRAGIAPPASIAGRGFDWRKGWSDSWTASTEGAVYLRTLPHFFVKPDPDGKFRISGVAPGEYDLAFRLYGTTEGCLVHPVGMIVAPVTVKEGQSKVDLGLIKVPAVPGLKVGDAAPTFEFVDAEGRKQSLAQSRGKYVLVDFWATWCGPCVASLPHVESIRQKYAERLGLIVVGANLDQDPQRAKEFLRERKLPWQHALLGDWSSTDTPKRFAVSSVPTYVLIGPDGNVLAHEISLDALLPILEKAPAQ